MTSSKPATKKKPHKGASIKKSLSTGRHRYTEAVLKAISDVITSTIKSEKTALGEVMHDFLINLSAPRTIDRKPNPFERYLGKLFYGHLEINKSLETLEDISFYIGRFPFKDTRITHERYLRFHVEAFVSEIYILSERLDKYITLIERQFKKDLSTPRASQAAQEIRIIVEDSLKPIIRTRGAHIHEQRLTEDNIDRLGSIDMLRRYGDGILAEVADLNYKKEAKRLKKHWRDFTKKNIKDAEDLLDIYFDALYPIAFDPETSQARKPNGIRLKNA